MERKEYRQLQEKVCRDSQQQFFSALTECRTLVGRREADSVCIDDAWAQSGLIDNDPQLSNCFCCCCKKKKPG